MVLMSGCNQLEVRKERGWLSYLLHSNSDVNIDSRVLRETLHDYLLDNYPHAEFNWKTLR